MRRPGACIRARSRAARPSEHPADLLDTGQRRICALRASVAATHLLFSPPVQHLSRPWAGPCGDTVHRADAEA